MPPTQGYDPFKSGFPLPWEIKAGTKEKEAAPAAEKNTAAPIVGKRKSEEPVAEETDVANNASVESGEIKEDLNPAKRAKIHEDLYHWYRCECDPTQYDRKTHYWHNPVLGTSQYEEPDEPYWIWDAATQGKDLTKGLQQPGTQKPGYAVIDGKVIERYNPAIHGDYDPSQPYAKYHDKLRELEDAANGITQEPTVAQQDPYASIAAFNSRTGAFQRPEMGAERHSDHNKSHRQMSAFFDVDAAANAHGGKSLKAERRQTRYTREEINAMNEKRHAKKQKKRMDWLNS